MKKTVLAITIILLGCSKDLGETKGSTQEGKDIKKESIDSDCRISFENTIKDLSEQNSFKPLFNFYKSSQDCMDGAISQGIEGAISKSLDKKWEDLKNLKNLFEEDSSFESFFFNNIGCYVSGTEAQLESVVKKALNSCPGGLEKLCSKLLDASKKALEYSKSQ